MYRESYKDRSEAEVACSTCDLARSQSIFLLIYFLENRKLSIPGDNFIQNPKVKLQHGNSMLVFLS